MQKVILFGDSHLAALKSGLPQVKVPKDIGLSFWGTPGNRFRRISWSEGAILPDDDKTAEAFARFSEEGLTRLDPAEFDAVVFVGVRIRPGVVVPDLLNHLAHPARHLTRDYMRLVLAEHYLKHTTYQIAREMAAAGKTRVLMAMVSLETHGKAPQPRAYKVARGAAADDLGLIWQLTAEILAEDGITYVPQPLETVVEGYYTDARFGVEGEDAVHKNADYGALMLKEIFRALG